MAAPNRYMQIIERIFLSIHKKGEQEVLFSRNDIEKAAATLASRCRKTSEMSFTVSVTVFRYHPQFSNVPPRAKNGLYDQPDAASIAL